MMPRDPGDTCVLGWQLTALRSAHVAGLDVHADDVFANASKFLDSVAIRDGAENGYQPGMVCVTIAMANSRSAGPPSPRRQAEQ